MRLLFASAQQELNSYPKKILQRFQKKIQAATHRNLLVVIIGLTMHVILEESVRW